MCGRLITQKRENKFKKLIGIYCLSEHKVLKYCELEKIQSLNFQSKIN